MTEVPDNPDEECNECGNRSWNKFESRPPTDYPDNTEVVKHMFECTNCGAHGFIYSESGHHRYTAALRK